ncbi:CarD family transcriptional regulator [Laceyella putida]|uniref:CarD family transcriptional regulator n=1 Tax=Laceyella putida TaxID=110101 RepID=A0ABW2RGV6_9BACL
MIALFRVGDKVVYPMHGAGIIEAVEEKEILGVKQPYYVLNITTGNMQVMIPVTKAAELGIRSIVDLMELDDILNNSSKTNLDPSIQWNQRHRVFMDKMRTGNIQDGVDVIRELAFRSQTKTLSRGEKTVLDQARQIFISELVLVKGITEDQAVDLLEQMVDC